MDSSKSIVGVPFGFYEKSESVKHLLKPPVGNHLIFGQKEQLKVMFVGGPNVRPDYHINEGEELFFQLKGPLDLKIVEHNRPRTVRVEQGQMFCLPARVPHSPQRHADSCGLVIERERLPSEWDGLRWFIDDSSGAAKLDILYEDYFHCFDLGVQLKPAIEKYLASETSRTRIPPPGVPVKDPPILVVSMYLVFTENASGVICSGGDVMMLKLMQIYLFYTFGYFFSSLFQDGIIDVPTPFALAPALASLPNNATTALHDLFSHEVVVQVVKGAYADSLLSTFDSGQIPREMFLWRVQEGAAGECVCRSAGNSWSVQAGEAVYIKTSGEDFSVNQQDGNLLIIYNKVYQP